MLVTALQRVWIWGIGSRRLQISWICVIVSFSFLVLVGGAGFWGGGREIYSLEEECRTRIGVVAAADMWTMVTRFSEARTLSRDETVTSVLCVTYESGLRDCTRRPLVDGSLPALHVEFVLVQPELLDSDIFVSI